MRQTGWTKAYRARWTSPTFRNGRGDFDSILFLLGEYLVDLAAIAPTRDPLFKSAPELDRGQCVIRLGPIAKLFGLHKQLVSKKLQSLACSNFVRTETDPGTQAIKVTVCNYERYQAVGDSAETVSETVRGRCADGAETGFIIEEVKKKRKKEERESGSGIKAPDLSPASLSQGEKEPELGAAPPPAPPGPGPALISGTVAAYVAGIKVGEPPAEPPPDKPPERPPNPTAMYGRDRSKDVLPCPNWLPGPVQCGKRLVWSPRNDWYFCPKHGAGGCGESFPIREWTVEGGTVINGAFVGGHLVRKEALAKEDAEAEWWRKRRALEADKRRHPEKYAPPPGSRNPFTGEDLTADKSIDVPMRQSA